jgi:hypothetical protein
MFLEEKSTVNWKKLAKIQRPRDGYHPKNSLWHSNFSKRSRSWQFRSDASSIISLFWVTNPVVPEGSWPFWAKLVPKLLRHHPTESREEIGAVKQIWLGFVDEAFFAVVVPRWNAPKRFVDPQQWERAQEVLVKVRRDVKIVWWWNLLITWWKRRKKNLKLPSTMITKS